MVMGARDDVETASLPVTVIDTVALGGQLVAALARLPFQRPFAGSSSLPANLGTNVTREVLRTFMGTTTGLPIDEFRSVEQVIDGVCGVVMPPVVRGIGVEQRQLELGGVPGLLYLPAGRPPEGVVLYLHGGGFIGTSPRMYAAFVAWLCRETSCAVFVADYRLAPEFPYPAGVEDAASVLQALIDLGAPSERLFVAGDSAGGGLATSLLLAADQLGVTTWPAGLILFSPEVDLVLDEPSVRANAPSDILPWNIPTTAYLRGQDDGEFVDAARADLSRFPPTYVTWGGDEMFRDAIRMFVAHLADAGVEQEGHEWPGMFHVFPILMPWAEQSRAVYRNAARFVDEILSGAPPMPSEIAWP